MTHTQGRTIRPSGSTFVERTITDGTVRMHGRVLIVDSLLGPMPGHKRVCETIEEFLTLDRREQQYAYVPYDGRWDGRRAVFGRYRSYDNPGQWEPFAELHHFPDEEFPGSGCIDGWFLWSWWRTWDDATRSWRLQRKVRRSRVLPVSDGGGAG